MGGGPMRPAHGTDLDILGELFGVTRDGEADAAYRERMATMTSAQMMHGPLTAEQLDTYLYYIADVRRFTVTYPRPHTMLVQTQGGDEAAIREWIGHRISMGTAFDVVVTAAPWWWRAWRWMRRAIGR